MVSSGDAKSKVDLLEPCKILQSHGYTIYATEGTKKFLGEHGINAITVGWPDEGAEMNIMDMISKHGFDLVVNIPKNHTKRELTNGYRIRRWAVDHNIPLLTNARLAGAYVNAFLSKPIDQIGITPWQEY